MIVYLFDQGVMKWLFISSFKVKFDDQIVYLFC